MCRIFFTLFNIIYSLSNVDALTGRSTDRNEFPFIVSIGNIHATDNNCGGALISHRHVLTSEHCVHNQRARNLQVLIGDLHSNRKYSVESIMRFDDWTKRHHSAAYPNNDVAILTLEKDVTNVKPGLIDEASGKTTFYNQNVVTVRLGKDGQTQKSNLTLLTPDQCNENLYRLTRKRYEINEKYFCTVAMPHAVLGKDDEGSPILHNNLIIGVNHGTFPDLMGDNVDQLNLHIGVEYYRRFISDILSYD